MQSTRRDFTLTERWMIVAILVIAVLIATQNLLQSVEQTEERTLNSAVSEYAAVKGMYAAGAASAPRPLIQATAVDTDSYSASAAK